MEIKVKYKGQVVGLIDFDLSTAIEKMRELGYCSFSVRSQVNRYEDFAVFKNEDTEEALLIYPDKSFMKSTVCYDCRVSHYELSTIKILLDYYTTYKDIEEESE